MFAWQIPSGVWGLGVLLPNHQIVWLYITSHWLVSLFISAAFTEMDNTQCYACPVWDQAAFYPFQQVSAGCPMVCECPVVPPSCPPGDSSVLDACGCCKVCAAQLNQDCHEGQPCDHHKGLECNYGNDVEQTHGICRGTGITQCCYVHLQIEGKFRRRRFGLVWIVAEGRMRDFEVENPEQSGWQKVFAFYT